MSLTTYVLLSGLLYGSAGEFNPDVLQDVMFSCMLTQMIEVAGIRAGYYMLQAPCTLTDLMSYTGYKYPGLCINMIVGIIFGYMPYNVALMYTATAVGFFELKTFANNVPRGGGQAGVKREFVVLGFAGMQMVTMWWMGKTKHME